jgi:glutamate dehydrogenase
MTQRSRIEAAQNGVKLNADFIDNSGGVDCSDHEVNIKILLTEIMSGKDNTLTLPSRNKLLAQMTEEVAALVLRDNDQQAEALSLMELQAPDQLPLHARFIQDLEREGLINRALEALPDEEDIQARLRQGKGLTRPELGILQAHAKILFTRALLSSDVPDHPDTQSWLLSYFPQPLQKKYKTEIGSHRLRREIIATTLATAVVNRMGPVFVKSCMDRTGTSAADVARAWIIVREVFGLEALWAEIESLDGKIPAQVQLKAMRDIAKMAERETLWFLTRLGRAPDIGQDIEGFRSGTAAFGKSLDSMLTDDMAMTVKERTQIGTADGLPKELARRIACIPALGAACDVIRIADKNGVSVEAAAKTYFRVGAHFHIDWLRRQAEFMTASDRWTAEALANLIENFYACQAGLTVRVLADMKKHSKGGKGDIMAAWMDGHGREAAQLDPFFAALRQAGTLDMAMLVIAEQRLRGLYGG